MIKEIMYEQFYGIDTKSDEAIVNNPDCRYEDTEAYYAYDATSYAGLVKIFNHVPLTEADSLVDFGCGLGRVLFYCNQRFMCKVTGIEYDRDIYNRLLKNAEFYHVRFKNQQRKFALLRMDAREYEIASEDNVFYFFNPFSQDILLEIMTNIAKSANRKPRKITVILYYCTIEMMQAMRKTDFTLKEIIKLPGYEEDPDEKAYIYQLL